MSETSSGHRHENSAARIVIHAPLKPVEGDHRSDELTRWFGEEGASSRGVGARSPFVGRRLGGQTAVIDEL